MLTITLALAAAIGAFLAGSSFLNLRAERSAPLAAPGAGGRRGAPSADSMRDRLERPFSKLAERRGRGTGRGRKSLAEELGQAGLTLRTSEWLMIRFGTAGLLGLLGLARFQSIVQALLLAILGYFLPSFYLRYRQSSRRRAFARP